MKTPIDYDWYDKREARIFWAFKIAKWTLIAIASGVVWFAIRTWGML